ncbi:MAG TPA: rhomboid family intramembrane serine protease [Chryseosolibacter sp.]
MPHLQSALPSPRKMPFTLTVVGMNVAVFIASFIVAGTLTGQKWTITLLVLGAQFNPLALDREPYRILTHMFLHGGIIHLALNMYMLLYAGLTMEAKVGTKKFAFVYFVSGIAAAFNGLYWNLFNIGVGASEAIMGLLGFWLVYQIFFPGKGGRQMVILLIHCIVFVSMNVLFPGWMYPDYAAQFAGVMAGAFIGFFSFAPGRRDAIGKVRVEYVMIVALVILFFLLPRNQVRYFKFFKQVVAAEDTTRHLLKEKLNDDDMRMFIKNYHHWEDILTRLDEQTNLPAGLGSDTFKLRKYIGLRKQENLFKKLVVQRETYTYLDSVEYLEALMRKYRDLDYALWANVRMAPETPDSAGAGMVKVLYDSNDHEIHEPPAAYYRVGHRDSLGRWDGTVRDYYANGNIRMKGVYRNDKRDGVFLYYTDKNKYIEAGRYVDGKRFGKWQTYHANGKLEAEIFYNNGRFVHSMWDSLGNSLVVDGNGRDIRRYPNGVIAQEGEYRYGLKDGYWYGRYANGEMYFEETFNRGRLVSGKSRSPEGETFVYDESSLYPMPEGGFEKLQQYVKSKPRAVREDELGHVKLSFKVTSRGALADVSIEQSASPRLDAKAKEILLNGPRWLPAREHGHKAVDAEVPLLIEFY